MALPQGHQRQNPTFALVIGLHDKEQILDGDDQQQRPDDEREQAGDRRQGDG